MNVLNLFGCLKRLRFLVSIYIESKLSQLRLSFMSEVVVILFYLLIPYFVCQKNDSLTSSPSGSFDTDNLPNGNAGAIVPYDSVMDGQGGTRRQSFSRRVDELSAIDTFSEATQAGELFSATLRGRRPPPVSTSGDAENMINNL